jgi:hypothetical protein
LRVPGGDLARPGDREIVQDEAEDHAHRLGEVDHLPHSRASQDRLGIVEVRPDDGHPLDPLAGQLPPAHGHGHVEVDARHSSVRIGRLGGIADAPLGREPGTQVQELGYALPGRLPDGTAQELAA